MVGERCGDTPRKVYVDSEHNVVSILYMVYVSAIGGVGVAAPCGCALVVFSLGTSHPASTGSIMSICIFMV